MGRISTTEILHKNILPIHWNVSFYEKLKYWELKYFKYSTKNSQNITKMCISWFDFNNKILKWVSPKLTLRKVKIYDWFWHNNDLSSQDNRFHSWKWIWKCCLQNGNHFVSASILLREFTKEQLSRGKRQVYLWKNFDNNITEIWEQRACLKSFSIQSSWLTNCERDLGQQWLR